MNLSIKPIITLLIFACLAAFGLGCDEPRSKRADPQVLPPKDPQIDPEKSPKVSLLEVVAPDSTCQKSVHYSSLASVFTSIWDKELTFVNLPESSKNSPKGLKTTSTLSTRFGLEIDHIYQIKIDEFKNITDIRQSAFLKADSTSLKICDDQEFLERRTYESAAASAAAIVENAYQVYSQVKDSIKLDAITIEVFPSILEQFKIISHSDLDSERYVTDNAAYGDGIDEPTIFLIPRSKQSLADGFFPDFDLWESPFVISHEYGHHVFNTYLKEGAKQVVSQSWHANFQFIPIFPVSRFSGGIDLGPAENVHLALNEGFADLFSFYVNKEGEHLLDSHTCLQDIRDVNSLTVVKGREKILTSNTLSYILEGKTHTLKTSCEAPDWQPSVQFDDPHFIGALWAYGFNQILSKAIDADQKLSILLKWLRLWTKDKLIQSSSDPEYLLSNALELLLQVIQHAEQPQASTCEIVRSIFPGFLELASAENLKLTKTCLAP